MKRIIFDAQTGETTIIVVPDEEMPVVPVIEPVANLEDRVIALEGTTTEIVETLNTKGLIP